MCCSHGVLELADKRGGGGGHRVCGILRFLGAEEYRPSGADASDGLDCGFTLDQLQITVPERTPGPPGSTKQCTKAQFIVVIIIPGGGP